MDSKKITEEEMRREVERLKIELKPMADKLNSQIKDDAGVYADNIYNQLRTVNKIKSIAFKAKTKGEEHLVILSLETVNEQNEVVKADFELLSFEAFEFADYIAAAIAKLGKDTEFAEFITL